MTTATADSTDKIKRNAEIARKSISTYVVHAAAFGGSILIALGPEWVTAFIQQHWASAAAGPIVWLAFWWLARLTPQNFTLASDRQKLARAWVLDLAARLMPGQPMALPPEIAKAAGLPSVVHPNDPNDDENYPETLPPPVPPVAAPVSPPAAPTVPPPMPGTAIMRTQLTPLPDAELAQRLRLNFPGASDIEIAAAAASLTRPQVTP